MSSMPYQGPRKERYCGRESASAVAARAGGYHFKDSGDKQGGVWTDSVQAQEAARQRTQERAAAEQAEAEMQARIDAIVSDYALTVYEKRQQLARLSASGYSQAEFEMLQNARESV